MLASDFYVGSTNGSTEFADMDMTMLNAVDI